MDTKKHYNKYWSSKDREEQFFDYERNWVLPDLFQKREKVLDLGCGDGAVAEFLQKELGMEVIGVDLSDKAVKETRKRGIKAIVVNAEEKLPFRDGEFNTVFWGDNVEHLFSPETALKEIRRVSKKGGRLILSCPNMGYWRYRLYYLVHGRLSDTEWSGNPPWGWFHIRFFNKKIIKDFLDVQDFQIKKTIGVSRRLPDKILLSIAPSIFGMILVVEAKKK